MAAPSTASTSTTTAAGDRCLPGARKDKSSEPGRFPASLVSSRPFVCCKRVLCLIHFTFTSSSFFLLRIPYLLISPIYVTASLDQYKLLCHVRGRSGVCLRRFVSRLPPAAYRSVNTAPQSSHLFVIVIRRCSAAHTARI